MSRKKVNKGDACECTKQTFAEQIQDLDKTYNSLSVCGIDPDTYALLSLNTPKEEGQILVWVKTKETAPVYPNVNLRLLHTIIKMCDQTESKQFVNEQELIEILMKPLCNWASSRPMSILGYITQLPQEALQKICAAGFGLVDMYLVAAPKQLKTLHSSGCPWVANKNAMRTSLVKSGAKKNFRRMFPDIVQYWQWIEDGHSTLPDCFVNWVNIVYAEASTSASTSPFEAALAHTASMTLETGTEMTWSDWFRAAFRNVETCIPEMQTHLIQIVQGLQDPERQFPPYSGENESETINHIQQYVSQDPLVPGTNIAEAMLGKANSTMYNLFKRKSWLVVETRSRTKANVHNSSLFYRFLVRNLANLLQQAYDFHHVFATRDFVTDTYTLVPHASIIERQQHPYVQRRMGFNRATDEHRSINVHEVKAQCITRTSSKSIYMLLHCTHAYTLWSSTRDESVRIRELMCASERCACPCTECNHESFLCIQQCFVVGACVLLVATTTLKPQKNIASDETLIPNYCPESIIDEDENTENNIISEYLARLDAVPSGAQAFGSVMPGFDYSALLTRLVTPDAKTLDYYWDIFTETQHVPSDVTLPPMDAFDEWVPVAGDPSDVLLVFVLQTIGAQAGILFRHWTLMTDEALHTEKTLSTSSLRLQDTVTPYMLPDLAGQYPVMSHSQQTTLTALLMTYASQHVLLSILLYQNVIELNPPTEDEPHITDGNSLGNEGMIQNIHIVPSNILMASTELLLSVLPLWPRLNITLWTQIACDLPDLFPRHTGPYVSFHNNESLMFQSLVNILLDLPPFLHENGSSGASDEKAVNIVLKQKRMESARWLWMNIHHTEEYLQKSQLVMTKPASPPAHVHDGKDMNTIVNVMNTDVVSAVGTHGVCDKIENEKKTSENCIKTLVLAGQSPFELTPITPWQARSLTRTEITELDTIGQCPYPITQINSEWTTHPQLDFPNLMQRLLIWVNSASRSKDTLVAKREILTGLIVSLQTPLVVRSFISDSNSRLYSTSSPDVLSLPPLNRYVSFMELLGIVSSTGVIAFNIAQMGQGRNTYVVAQPSQYRIKLDSVISALASVRPTNGTWLDPWSLFDETPPSSTHSDNVRYPYRWWQLFENEVYKSSSSTRELCNAVKAIIHATDEQLRGGSLVFQCHSVYTRLVSDFVWFQKCWNFITRIFFIGADVARACTPFSEPLDWKSGIGSLTTWRVSSNVPRAFWIDMKTELRARAAFFVPSMDITKSKQVIPIGTPVQNFGGIVSKCNDNILSNARLLRRQLDPWRHYARTVTILPVTDKHMAMNLPWLDRKILHKQTSMHWQQPLVSQSNSVPSSSTTRLAWEPAVLSSIHCQIETQHIQHPYKKTVESCGLSPSESDTLRGMLRREMSIESFPTTLIHQSALPKDWATLIMCSKQPSDAGTLIVVCDSSEHVAKNWFKCIAKYCRDKQVTCEWIDHIPAKSTRTADPCKHLIRHCLVDGRTWQTEDLTPGKNKSSTKVSTSGFQRPDSIVLMTLSTLNVLYNRAGSAFNGVFRRFWGRVILTNNIAQHFASVVALWYDVKWIIGEVLDPLIKTPFPRPLLPTYEDRYDFMSHNLATTLSPDPLPFCSVDYVELKSSFLQNLIRQCRCEQCMFQHFQLLSERTLSLVQDEEVKSDPTLEIQVWEDMLIAHVMILRWDWLATWSLPVYDDTPLSDLYWHNLTQWQRSMLQVGFTRDECCTLFFTALIRHQYPCDEPPTEKKKARVLFHTRETLRQKTIENDLLTPNKYKNLEPWTCDYEIQSRAGLALPKDTKADAKETKKSALDTSSLLPWLPRNKNLQAALAKWAIEKRCIMLSEDSYGRWMTDFEMLASAIPIMESQKARIQKTFPCCLATEEARSIISQMVWSICSGDMRLDIFSFAMSGNGKATDAQRVTETSLIANGRMTLAEVRATVDKLKPTGPTGLNKSVIFHIPTKEERTIMANARNKALVAKAKKPTKKRKTNAPTIEQEIKKTEKEKSAFHKLWNRIRTGTWMWQVDYEQLAPGDFPGSVLRVDRPFGSGFLWMVYDHSEHDACIEAEQYFMQSVHSPCAHASASQNIMWSCMHEEGRLKNTVAMSCPPALNVCIITSRAADYWTRRQVQRYLGAQTTWSNLPPITVAFFESLP